MIEIEKRLKTKILREFFPVTRTPSCVSAGIGHCQLKFVNFDAQHNHVCHETQGLSTKQLVVRRGKPFSVTLMFDGRSWNPHAEILGLEVWLGTQQVKD